MTDIEGKMADNDPEGLYRVLGVQPSATAAEIKTAFRKLAKETHPDISHDKSSDTFRKISAAYEILSDPIRRAEYDSSAFQHSAYESKAIAPICCSRCGQVTAQPRNIVFFRVYSFIFVTTRNPIQGIFCASCARKEGLKSSVITLFTGWWGAPWGPIYSIGSILSNGFGGKHDRSADEGMAWYNALAFLSRGNMQLAYALSLKSKKALNKDIARDAAELVAQLEKAGANPKQGKLLNPWRTSLAYKAGHLFMAFALPVALGIAIFASTQGSRAGSGDGGSQLYSAPPASTQYRPSTQTTARNTNVPTCMNEPFSGQLLGASRLSELEGHSLEIQNGSSGNAIIKVRAELSGSVVAAFFVRSNQTAQITGIPDGRYTVQYAFGDVLDVSCRNFVSLAGAGQFPGTETLQTERTETQIITQVLSYTLYAVPAGNVRPQSISAEEFERQ
ncbi:DnaJ domain-containing protein [Rhizobium sp. R86522]|uniref:J domain-containing protein n=1 Tax=Rhizobium sp. R86522 TaxID=3093861 RepID=UPI00366FB459